MEAGRTWVQFPTAPPIEREIMATYQFICSNCEVTKDVVADITEKPVSPKCEKCDVEMQRKYGLQTIRFIGNGWGKDAR